MLSGVPVLQCSIVTNSSIIAFNYHYMNKSCLLININDEPMIPTDNW